MYQRSCKCHYSLLILVILSFWWQCSWAYYRTPDIILNPNIPCPGKNEDNIWRRCKHGGYIENYDTENCGDRYVCYVGLDEFCYPGDRCANNAMCTSCGICQKCESREKCSEFRLCPGIRGMNFTKRFIHKRLIEFDDEWGERTPRHSKEYDIENGYRY